MHRCTVLVDFNVFAEEFREASGIQEFSWIMYCLLCIHDCVNWVIGLWWSFKFWNNKIFISSICSLVGDSIALSWNQFSVLVDMLLISGYTFSVNSSSFFSKTQRLLRVIVIYTITYLEQVSRKMPIIFARRYYSHIRFSSHFVICGQRYDLLSDALTSSALVPLVITGKIWRKSAREQNSTTTHWAVTVAQISHCPV